MIANRPVLIFSGIRKLWNVPICVFHTIYTYCMWKSVWKAYKTLYDILSQKYNDSFFEHPVDLVKHTCVLVMPWNVNSKMGVIINKLNIQITTIYSFYNNIQLHIIFVLVELGCPKGCMFRQRRQQKHMGICHSWNCRGSLHFANPCNRSFHRNRIGKGS